MRYMLFMLNMFKKLLNVNTKCFLYAYIRTLARCSPVCTCTSTCRRPAGDRSTRVDMACSCMGLRLERETLTALSLL